MLVQGARGCGVSPNARERGGRPLTECTVVGRAVDLDPVAHNHQVGGHLCALVCLHLDVLPVLTDRQVLQVAHPLTCGGYRDRKLAEAGPTPRLTVGKVITPPRDVSLGPLSCLIPKQQNVDILSPGDPSGEKFQKATGGKRSQASQVLGNTTQWKPLPSLDGSLPIPSKQEAPAQHR